MSVTGLRRAALVSWVLSAVLILLAGVLLIFFGTDPVRPGDVDIDVQRAVPQRTVTLGTVGTVALLGAVAFAVGAALRVRADEAERREVSSVFGVRPARPPRGPVLPPARGSHDDLLTPPGEPPSAADQPPTPDDTDREQP